MRGQNNLYSFLNSLKYGISAFALLAILVILRLKDKEIQYGDPVFIETSNSSSIRELQRSHDAGKITGIEDSKETISGVQYSQTDDSSSTDKSVNLIKGSRKETEYNKQIRLAKEQILKDMLDSGEDLRFLEEPYALLGKIKKASDFADYVAGKKGNPLAGEVRQMIDAGGGLVTLGQSVYENIINQNNSVNSSSGSQSQMTAGQWMMAGIVQANKAIGNGSMEVGWNGNSMVVNYLGTSTLVNQTATSLIYNIANGGQRVLMGMNQQVEEMLVKNSVITGTDNEWYEILLQLWVKEIRLTEMGIIEIWNDKNAVMKVKKPEAIDNAGNLLQCWWIIENIIADEVTSISKPGSVQGWSVSNPTKMVIRLSTDMDPNTVFPVVIDPSWSTAGSLGTARRIPGVFALTDSKVLAAGGFDGTNILSTCELYDTTTGVWSSTGSMSNSRWYFAGVVRPNSNVLISGGYQSGLYLTGCELFDPSTATWTATGSLGKSRTLHTLTLLASSDTTLAVGGFDGSSNSLSTTEKWVSDTWTYSGSLNTARRGHVSVLLQNDKIVAIGGDQSSSTKSISSSELYDPSTATWSLTGSLNTGRRLFAGTMISNGNVVAIGGRNSSDTVLTACELYDSSAGTWAYTGSLATARSLPNTALLQTGIILVAGGYDGASYLSSTELYAAGTFAAGTAMGTERATHGTVPMYDGHILVVGGNNASSTLSSTEYLRPVDGTWTLTGSLNDVRRRSSCLLLNNDKVLAAGGIPASGVNATCELYNSATWTYTGSFTARSTFSVVTMTDGKAMAVGGYDASDVTIATVELYDVSAGTWSATGSLDSAVALAPAVVLSNGNVLLVGGSTSSGVRTQICQLYSASTWTRTGSLNNTREGSGTVYLSNGKVLAAGGTGSTSTSELYNSATWTVTGSLNAARTRPNAIYLPNGKVLCAGGDSAVTELYDVSAGTWATSGSLASAIAKLDAFSLLLENGKVVLCGGLLGTSRNTAELYDPVTGTWTLTGSLNTGRQDMSGAFLSTGKLLLVGGRSGSSNLSSCELFDPTPSRSATLQATITSVEGSSSFPVSITKSAVIDIIGTNFKGKTEGSTGRYSSSSTGFPVVFLKRVTDLGCSELGGTNDQYFFPISSSWTSSTSLTFTASSGLQSNGYYQLRVIVNGVASDAKIVKAVD
ncbi:MAG: hypothetical protein HY606_01445 [Planctomycetes bacterium]|nr:hypothetical protein [Planctomycetota bacterium]